MKQKTFFTALLVLIFSFLTLAQSTVTGTLKADKPVGFPAFTWTVASADFDSAAAIWSPGFSFDGYTAATFDAQGQINLGTAASGGTYSTVLLMYGSNDLTNWILVDSLGTVTSTNDTKISIDLDDWDQCTYYKIKATNGGAQNSFLLAIKSEYNK